MKRGFGSVFLGGFALLWSVGIGAVDYKYLQSVARQARTAGYARTEGEITSSGVTTSRSSEGTAMHGVALAYTYAVGGRTFEGMRYRTGFTEETGSAAADLARQFPVGARVPVYYAPQDPAQAVLRPGLTTAEAFPALFIFPFNAAAVGIWWAFAVQRRRSTDRTPGGLKLVEADGVTRVLAPSPGPLGAALGWAAVTDFILTAVVAIKFGFEPPAWAVVGVIVMVVIVAALGGWRSSVRRRQGIGTLVIDMSARTLRPARVWGAAPRDVIVWSSIAEIVLHRTYMQSETLDAWVYRASLSLVDGASVPLSLATWYEREQAEHFRAWLAERIGRPAGRGILGGS